MASTNGSCPPSSTVTPTTTITNSGAASGIGSTNSTMGTNTNLPPQNPNSVLTNNININNTSSTIQTTPASTPQSPAFKIVFTHIQGSTRIFHQLCKNICMQIANSNNYLGHHRQRQQHQQQQQPQQTPPQPQTPSTPKLSGQQLQQSTNSYMHNYTSQTPTQQSPMVLHHHSGNAPATPILNSSIGSVNQSPLLTGSRLVNTNGSTNGPNYSTTTTTTTSTTSSSSTSTASPSITTPRRNSNNLHVSINSSTLPSGSLVNNVGGSSSVAASPLVQKTTQYIQAINFNGSLVSSPAAIIGPTAPTSSSSSSSSSSSTVSAATTTSSSSSSSSNHYSHNRKNSNTSLNSHYQPMAPPSPLQQHHQVQTNSTNIFNSQLLINPSPYNMPNQQSQNSQFNSNGKCLMFYSFTLNRCLDFSENLIHFYAFFV